ncbi:MAG: Crp/Fnr family transcriptional regulator [Planctomycetes bacterium]|nr:Crp/Fnr family transcriptional regulator [Planctomycetota bacterium]
MTLPAESHVALRNRILRSLPAQEYERLLTLLEPVTLEYKQVLCEAGDPIRHVYFPDSGVVSWLASASRTASVEVATIGNEGMVGFRLFLGGDTCTAKVMVQVAGHGLRMNRADFLAEIRSGSHLIPILHRYVSAFLTQVTQSVACNTFHTVEQRSCRWLLMTHDRVAADQFRLTHDLLGRMLGVRRASVTVVARKLQEAGLIRYTHGKITILDRAGLESASCGCYQTVKADYDNLLGPTSA